MLVLFIVIVICQTYFGALVELVHTGYYDNVTVIEAVHLQLVLIKILHLHFPEGQCHGAGVHYPDRGIAISLIDGCHRQDNKIPGIGFWLALFSGIAARYFGGGGHAQVQSLGRIWQGNADLVGPCHCVSHWIDFPDNACHRLVVEGPEGNLDALPHGYVTDSVFRQVDFHLQLLGLNQGKHRLPGTDYLSYLGSDGGNNSVRGGDELGVAHGVFALAGTELAED